MNSAAVQRIDDVNQLAEHYGTDYKMTLLYTGDVEDGLKGRCPATECVWLLEQN